jgi:hypothetical protein
MRVFIMVWQRSPARIKTLIIVFRLSPVSRSVLIRHYRNYYIHWQGGSLVCRSIECANNLISGVAGLAVLALFAWHKTIRLQNHISVYLQASRMDPRFTMRRRTIDAHPREAQEHGIQGDVLLHATIDTKGNLTNVRSRRTILFWLRP